MTDLIKEPCIWDFLKDTSLPVILYGMGNGADMVIEALESIGISFTDIFASDEFVRGHSFHGVRVKTYREIQKLYPDFIILMTFAVHDEITLGKIRKMSREHLFLSPTVPIAGTGLFTLDYIKRHECEFDEAYSLLADEKSKSDFTDVLNFKISGKPEYLFRCQTEKNELYRTVFPLDRNETILDLGAYDGDTIREFLNVTNGQYEKIYAFEPDPKNFKKLCAKTAETENISLFHLGAWDKKETLFFQKNSARSSHQSLTGTPVSFDRPDSVIKDKVTLIKMDIEGAESKAIDGCRELILKYKPKLYVCGYHRNEDFFALPLKIHGLCPGYKIYFRHHPYVPAWESNFYCVYDEN